MANAYDPKAYWQERPHPNTAEAPGINDLDRAFLAPRAARAGSILEIGPGVGRLFPLYKDAETVATLDISTNYADRARAAAAEAGIEVAAHFREASQESFPFADAAFDLGVMSHVLQHVTFEDVAPTMREAARVCREVAVISDQSPSWPKKGQAHAPGMHCFDHDYRAVCDEIGCEVTSFERHQNGPIAFVYRRR